MRRSGWGAALLWLGCVAPALGPGSASAGPARAAGVSGAATVLPKPSNQGPAAKTGARTKIGADLVELRDEFQSFSRNSGLRAPAQPFRPRNPLLRTRGGGVVIDVAAAGDVGVLTDDLMRLGMTGPVAFGRMVSGRLPIAALGPLAALDSVRFARPAYAATQAGAVSSQGDQALRSDLARATLGVDGTGITVGTLSDSYDCLGGAATDVLFDDLPGGVVVLKDEPGCVNGTDEGRAMMQIVHDVAPGAGQAFHTAFDGMADFASGILDLATVAAAHVIVDDVIYFTEPMFQDGLIAQAVDDVKAMGVAYFSSAGNNARQSYESAFRDSGVRGHFGGAARHDFDPGPGVDDLQTVTIASGRIVTWVFQWDQPFFSVSGAPGSASDVDILLYDKNGGFLAGGVDNNRGGDPVEVLTFTNDGSIDADGDGVPDTTFQVGLELFFGPAPDVIKYIHFGTLTIDEHATASATSYGHANAEGAEAVGAAAYFSTPAFGTDPALREGFSSAGGTPILFDTSGVATHVVRAKPEIVAPDGGDTTFFGSDIEPNGFPNFFGTSAAAPHAAAVAALLRETDPGLSPDEVYTTLEATALDMGAAGFDNDSGHGLIQADAALAAILPDADRDGVADAQDNCTLASNGPLTPGIDPANIQRDTDADGYGNICDTDLDNNGVTNLGDVGILKSVFLSQSPHADPNGDHADFNRDGVVNLGDVGILKTFFLQPPGPSGVAP